MNDNDDNIKDYGEVDWEDVPMVLALGVIEELKKRIPNLSAEQLLDIACQIEKIAKEELNNE